MYKILALDGGGVRGILQAGLIARLDSEFSIVKKSNAIAGTSVGSLIAAGLALGMRIDEISEVLESVSKKVFKKDFLKKFDSFWGLSSARHQNTALRKEAHRLFGEKKISDLKKKVLITSFNLNYTPSGAQSYYRPVVFHNIGSGSMADIRIIDACLSSAAAPTYLPTYSGPTQVSGHIDGGIWGNNPSMSIVSELLRPPRSKKISELACLSVGTGYNLNRVRAKNKSWGIYDWVKKGHLLDILTGDASVGAIHYYTETILGSNYHRLQPHIEPVSLDDASDKTISKLKKIGREFDITPTLSWLDGFFS